MFPYFKRAVDTSPEMARRELELLFPDREVRLEVSNRARLFLDGRCYSNRDSLRSLMNVARWYVLWLKDREAANQRFLRLIAPWE